MRGIDNFNIMIKGYPFMHTSTVKYRMTCFWFYPTVCKYIMDWAVKKICLAMILLFLTEGTFQNSDRRGNEAKMHANTDILKI